MADIDFAAITKEDAATNPPVAGETPPTVPADTIADPAAASGDEDTPAPAETAPKPKPVEKRIADLTAKRREAEREAKTLRETLDKVLNGNRQPAAQGPQQLDPSQFPNYEAYTAAIAKQAATDAIAATKAETRAEMEQERAAERATSFKQRLAKEGKGIEGFPEAMETLFSDDFTVSPVMASYLTEEADNPAQVVKWLTDNPEEAERIAGLTPIAAAKEMARRDALLGRKPATTKAPAPPPTVTGGGVAPQTIDRMSHEDIKKWAAAQQKR